MIVSGPCTDETLDRDQQIVDKHFARRALKEWYDELGAPVRNMHSGSYPPAGKGISLDLSGERPWIRVKVVEPTAVKLIDEGIYKDFSVGIFDPEIVEDPAAPGGRIVDGWIGEVSLVDIGSNKNAHFAIAKRAARHTRSRLYGVATAVTPKVVSAAPNRRNRMSDIDAARIEADLAAAISGAQAAGDIAGAAVAAAVTKSLAPSPATFKGSPDADVDEAIGDLMSDLEDAAEAQGEDNAEGDDKPTDEAVDHAIAGVGQAVSALAAAQAADALGKAAGRKCKACGGTGAIDGMKCMKCMGEGVMAKKAKKAAAAKVAAKAARAWYKLYKRDRDPNVGGGVDRDKLPSSAFVFPSERAFPVVTPGDVSDAVSSWGRYKGKQTFESFKKRLTALARRKGPKFVAALPESWKAKTAKASAQSKQVTCPECRGEGTILSGHRDCPLCHGRGTVPDSLAEQFRQKKSKPKKGSKTMQPGAAKAKKKAKAKAPKQKGHLKPVSVPEQPDEVGDVPPPGSNVGKRTKSSKAAQRVHDLLCPAWHTSSLAAAYPKMAGLPLADAINPRFFADQLAALTSGAAKARPDSVGEAYQAYAAAAKLASLDAPSFEKMHDAAAKAFENAYPNVRLRPGVINPDQFHRGFLSSAAPETSHTTRVPTPELHDSLTAGQFRRGPLTNNETRASLVGGSSVTGYTGGKSARAGKAKRAKQMKDAGVPAPVPSRLFYRSADKNEWASAMSILHDHIARHFPGTCPLNAVQAGSEIDSDGQMGVPAEMHATGPSLPAIVLPANAVGNMAPVKSAKVGKGPRKGQIDKRAIQAAVSEQVGKAVKPLRRRNAKLARQLLKAKTELRKPDRSRAPLARTHAFSSRTDPETSLKAAQARARVAELKTRAADRNSDVSTRAMAELQALLSPKEFAAVLVDTDD